MTQTSVRPARLPSDPAAFVTDAERTTNERTFEAMRGAYSEDAVFVCVADGAVTRAVGADEVIAAWRVLGAFMARRSFELTKTLLLAADGVIVNEWTGSLAGRTTATGIEVWRFDADGLICEHRLYSYLNTRDARSTLQRLRLFASYPLTAIAFGRAERAAARTERRLNAGRRSRDRSG
jgi:hypothetical protein